MKTTRPDGPVAFTLIELLVVMAIVAILTSLVIPALGTSRSKARQAGCANNLRQIGLGMVLYTDDHEGWLPTTSHLGGTNSSWIFNLSPYVGNADRIRICPSDRRGGDRLAARVTSYIMNEWTSVDQIDPFGRLRESFRHLPSLKRPSDTMTVLPVADDAGISAFQDHTHSRNWNKGWSAVIADIQPDRHSTGRLAPDRSQGTANYLFADGHVERIDASTLRQRIEQGDNFSKPPR